MDLFVGGLDSKPFARPLERSDSGAVIQEAYYALLGDCSPAFDAVNSSDSSGKTRLGEPAICLNEASSSGRSSSTLNARRCVATKDRRAQKMPGPRQKKRPYHVIRELQQRLDLVTQRFQELQTENGRLNQQAELLDKVVKLRDWHMKTLTQACEGPAELASSTPLVPCLTYLSFDQYASFYTQMVTLVRKWLLDIDRDPFVRTTISQLRQQFTERTAQLVLMNRPMALQILCTRLSDGVKEFPPEGYWMQVLSSLQLTKDQALTCTLAYERFASDFTQQGPVVQLTCQDPSPPQDKVAAATSPVVAKELSAVVTKQYDAGIQLFATLLKLVLSDQQWAVAVVRSYPWYPDAITISALIAQHQQ